MVIFPAILMYTLFSLAQAPQAPVPQSGPPAVEKLDGGRLRVGTIEIDTAKRELSVKGKINDLMTGETTLEFVASTVDGGKAYETALAIETDAVTLNTALLLIGLDPDHARTPTQHFDPIPPAGDPVEVFVEWTADGSTHRVRVEELLWDRRTEKSMPEGPWVYTGSSYYEGRFMATMDGVLIGFVHSPSPLIENPRAGAVAAFGSVVFNSRLGLVGGTPVTLIVRAIPTK